MLTGTRRETNCILKNSSDVISLFRQIRKHYVTNMTALINVYFIIMLF